MNFSNLNTIKVAQSEISKYSLIPDFKTSLKSIDDYNLLFRTNNKVVISGKPGTYKSALASEYACRKIMKNPNLIVKWLDGSNKTNFLADLKVLETELNSLVYEYTNKKYQYDNVYEGIKHLLIRICRGNIFSNFEILLIIDHLTAKTVTQDLMNTLDIYELNLYKIVKYVILTTDDFMYQRLKQSGQIQTKYISSEICANIIKDKFSSLPLEEIKRLLPSTETLPLRFYQFYSLMDYNIAYSVKDIEEFFENKIEFVKARNPKSFEILIYLSIFSFGFISLKLIKEIFSLEPQEEVGKALDFLIYHSYLVKSHAKKNYIAFYVHKLVQKEVLKSINWNKFNRNYMINRILNALDRLLDVNDESTMFECHNMLLFHQTYYLLQQIWQTPTRSYASLFFKVEKIKKNLLKYESDETEEFIQKIIQNSNLLADFRQIDLDERKFDLIKQRLIKNSFIFDVKWKLDSEWLNANRHRLDEINTIFANNLINYERYPSDFIHGILAFFATDFRLEKEKTNLFEIKLSSIFGTLSKNYTEKDKLREKLISLENEWNIVGYEIYEAFTCFIFCNETKKHVVLAFSGMKFQGKDLFMSQDSTKNSLSTFIQSMVTNHKIGCQTNSTYALTKYAIEKYSDYSLSFTGFTFGAWLAEQAVFFCHNDFNRFDVRSVTFDSPGSFEFLDKLNKKNIKQYTKYDLAYTDLDMRTYMSPPNLINTLHYHIGKVFYVKSPNKKDLTKAEFEKKIKELGLDSVIFNKMKKFVTAKKKFLIDRLVRALKLFKLRFMLHQFDLDTEKPLKNQVLEIANWPKIEMNVEADFDKNFSKLFSSGLVYNRIPFFNTFTFGMKQTIIKVTDAVVQPIAKEIFDVVLQGLSILVSLIVEVMQNRVKFDELEKTYEHGFRKVTSGNENISEKDSFHLKYDAKFALTKTDLFSRRLEPNNGNVDWYLKALHKLDVKDIDKFVKNELVNKELKRILNLIHSSVDEIGAKCISSKDKNIGLEHIKNRFEQLLIYEKNLKYFLSNYSNLENLHKIKSDELNFDFKNLILRESYLDRMDQALNDKQYLVLNGLSGAGKSTLAAQFVQHRYSYEWNTIFKFINCASVQLIKRDLISFIKNFEVNESNNDLDNDQLIDIIRKKINYNFYNYTFLFILDNVTELDYLKQFTHGFCENIQFIITTKFKTEFIDQAQFNNLSDKITVNNFDNLEMESLIRLRTNNLQLLQLIEVRQPSEVGYFINAYVNSTSGKRDSATFESKFDGLSKQAKEILKKCDILSCNFISLKLIELIFPDVNNLEKEFAYLVQNGYFKKNVIEHNENLKRNIYYMHQSAQDIKSTDKEIEVFLNYFIKTAYQNRRNLLNNPSHKIVTINQLNYLTENYNKLISGNRYFSDILKILIEVNGRNKDYYKFKSNIEILRTKNKDEEILDLLNSYGFTEYQFKFAKDKFGAKEYDLALVYFENLIVKINTMNTIKNDDLHLEVCKYKLDCLLECYSLDFKELKEKSIFQNLKNTFFNLNYSQYCSLYIHLGIKCIQNDKESAIYFYKAAIRSILEDESLDGKKYLAGLYFDLALLYQSEFNDRLTRICYENFTNSVELHSLDLNLLAKLKENIDYINHFDIDLAEKYYERLIGITSDRELNLLCFKNLIEIKLEKYRVEECELLKTQLQINISKYYEILLKGLTESLQSVYAQCDDYLALAHTYNEYLKFKKDLDLNFDGNFKDLYLEYYLKSLNIYKNLTLNRYDEIEMKITCENVDRFYIPLEKDILIF